MSIVHITHGWKPGADVTAFYAVDQESIARLGRAPMSPDQRRVGLGTADAAGTASLTLWDTLDGFALLLYGERIDPRDPSWIHTMPQLTPQTYIA